MQFTLSGRRIALAAVLVLTGAAAPLAYATIAESTAPATSAVPAAPLVAASPTSVQARAAVADNPYQVVDAVTSTAAAICSDPPYPAGQDFVLESVAVTSNGNVNISGAWVRLLHKDSPTVGLVGDYSIPLAATSAGSSHLTGTLQFTAVVRPDTFGAAAVGDVYDISVCARSANPGANASIITIVTGQQVASPSAASVLAFKATPRRTGATLRWTTGSESQILGFNLWRYRGGKGVKVNRSLIRAKRSAEPAGASYSFVDRAPGAKSGLTYRLQLVDQKGRRTWFAAFAIAS